MSEEITGEEITKELIKSLEEHFNPEVPTKIVGLTGLARSGKDTCSHYITEYLREQAFQCD